MKESLEFRVAAALRHARSAPAPLEALQWKVLIETSKGAHEVSFRGHAQLSKLAHDLQVCGFTLDVEADERADFVFVHSSMLSEAFR